MESCRTGGNPVGQESNVNILWLDIFMASHTEKQDNGSDRSCAVWLLCHSSLESISWMGISLSKLRPIYLTKSDNSSFSFHPEKNVETLKRRLQWAQVTVPWCNLEGVFIQSSVWSCLPVQSLHAWVSGQHAPILPLPPCSLKTSMSSRPCIQIETMPCGPLDSESTIFAGTSLQWLYSHT